MNQDTTNDLTADEINALSIDELAQLAERTENDGNRAILLSLIQRKGK